MGRPPGHSGSGEADGGCLEQALHGSRDVSAIRGTAGGAGGAGGERVLKADAMLRLGTYVYV